MQVTRVKNLHINLFLNKSASLVEHFLQFSLKFLEEEFKATQIQILTLSEYTVGGS
jgi:hypothetical protein